MSNRTRFPELDLLRFFAACAVMLFHYTFRAPLTSAWSASFPVLSQISKYGFLGVNVFFILSGFVILLTAYDKTAKGFTLARILRLYPAYWICVTLTTLGLILAGQGLARVTPGQYLANLTMVHSFFGINDVSGVYWTLAVELKFYFLIFLILAIRQIKRLGAILGLWLMVSISLSLLKAHGPARFFLFPEWSSYFIAGAMCFLIHREGPSIWKLGVFAGCYLLSSAYILGLVTSDNVALDPGLDAWLIVGLLALFYLVFLGIALRSRFAATTAPASRSFPSLSSSISGSSPHGPPLAQRLPSVLPLPEGEGRGEGERSAPLQGSGIPTASLRSKASSFPSPRPEAKFLYTLGLITYPLYLLHQDLGFIVLRLAPASLNRYVVLFALMAGMIAFAWFVHVRLERWLARRLKAFFARIEKAAPKPERDSLVRSTPPSALSWVVSPTLRVQESAPPVFPRGGAAWRHPSPAEAERTSTQSPAGSPAVPGGT